MAISKEHRKLSFLTPAPLQKLVGEFSSFFAGRSCRKFGRNFAGFFRVTKLRPKISGNSQSISVRAPISSCQLRSADVTPRAFRMRIHSEIRFSDAPLPLRPRIPPAGLDASVFARLGHIGRWGNIPRQGEGGECKGTGLEGGSCLNSGHCQRDDHRTGTHTSKVWVL